MAASDATNVRPAHQERSRDKRDRLIQAGLTEFGRRGFEQTRMADVARGAGVSVGVLYQRFKDKRGFFEVLVDTLAELLISEIDEFFEAAEAADPEWDLATLIEQIVVSLVRVMERDIGFLVALITVGDQVPGALDRIAAADQHRAGRLHAFASSRGLIDPSVVDESHVYLALATAIRMLLVTATIDRKPVRLRDPATIDALTVMLAAYLQRPSLPRS